MGLEGTVTFCCGGAFFTTHQETLMREPSSRLALISRGLIPATQDAQGVFFIDRDPKFFQLLLNFLRDGWCLLPASQEERMELLQEVRFHQLGGMDAWIRSQELLSSSSAAQGASAAFASPRGALPTVAYTGSPAHRRHVFATPERGAPQPAVAAAAAAATAATTASHAMGWSPSHLGAGARVQPAMGSGSSPGPSGRHAGTPAGGEHPLRAVFMDATAAGPSPAAAPAYSIPQVESGKAKWTAKYLRTNEGLREVANTLMGLAYIAPHRSLHAGKVSLRLSSECVHDRPSSLIAGDARERAHQVQQVVSVKNASSGWSFEMTLRPGSTDSELFDKCNVAEFVQDNWFVLSAVLKDQFGVVLEEDTSAGRPSCMACRKVHLAINLTKIY